MRIALPLLAAGLLLAGCGGSSATRTSTGAVAGVQATVQSSAPSFATSARALEQQISAAVIAFRHNGTAAVASAHGVLLSSCRGQLITQLTQRVHTAAERRVARQLYTACSDLGAAAAAARAGHAAKARQLAGGALAQAKAASAG